MGLVHINGGQGGTFNVPWEERKQRLGIGPSPSISMVISHHLCLLFAPVQYGGNDFDGLTNMNDHGLVSQHHLLILTCLTYHTSHHGHRSLLAGYMGGEGKRGSSLGARP